MALCKRVLQTGAESAFRFSGFRRNFYAPSSTGNSGYGLMSRQISQLVKPNGNRAFLVDTLALVRGLEAKGVPTKQAEAITAAITEVLNDSLENVAHAFVSKPEMQQAVMLQESNLSKFKSEVQSSQEHHFTVLQRETEKLRGDIEKMRSELRYEIDKVTAGQRLDLNLERGSAEWRTAMFQPTWAGELPYNRRRRRIAIVCPISVCNGDGDLLLLEKNKGRLLGVELDSPMKAHTR